MRAFLTTVHETTLFFFRDKIFFPLLILFLGLILFSNIASQWGIEEFYKILFDVGLALLHVFGVGIAFFWGGQLFSPANTKTFNLLAIVSPLGRTKLYLARQTGFICCLFLMALAAIGLWQGMMLADQFGWMTPWQMFALGSMFLKWCVAASLITFLSVATSSGMAVFLASSLWAAGCLMGSFVEMDLKKLPFFLQQAISGLGHVWNLSLLDINPLWTYSLTEEAWALLGAKALYATALVFCFSSAGMLIFAKKEF